MDAGWSKYRRCRGVMCYGQDRDEAVTKVQALALRVIAERLETSRSASGILERHVQSCVNNWPAAKARRVLAA